MKRYNECTSGKIIRETMNEVNRARSGTVQQPCSASTVPGTDPVMEAIARKLFGIDQVPLLERERMIRRAARAGAEKSKGQNAAGQTPADRKEIT